MRMNKRLPHPLSLHLFCPPWPQSRAPATWRAPRTRGGQRSGLLPEALWSRGTSNTAVQSGVRWSPESLQHSQKPESFRRVPGKTQTTLVSWAQVDCFKPPSKISDWRDFPGGPVAKTLSSQCRDLGSVPGRDTRLRMCNEDPCAPANTGSSQNKNKTANPSTNK